MWHLTLQCYRKVIKTKQKCTCWPWALPSSIMGWGYLRSTLSSAVAQRVTQKTCTAALGFGSGLTPPVKQTQVGQNVLYPISRHKPFMVDLFFVAAAGVLSFTFYQSSNLSCSFYSQSDPSWPPAANNRSTLRETTPGLWSPNWLQTCRANKYGFDPGHLHHICAASEAWVPTRGEDR